MILTAASAFLAAQLLAAYAPGTIRPNHRSQAQQDEDVRAFYDHWKKSYLVEAGPGLYRVTMGKTQPHRTTSESQGYGMLIVALMAPYDPQAQTIFDGLWSFSRKYPSAIDRRLMSWEIPPGGQASAFDGDADIAYALLLAHARWGSSGAIDYCAAANTVITGIFESTIGPQSRLPTLGDWVDPRGAKHNEFTPRSSDFMPGHFRAFAKATGNPVWLEVVAESQAVIDRLQTDFSPNTGLLPDFIVNGKPAPPNFLEKEVDGAYYYNAGRDPWRIGTDAVLHGDATSTAQASRISRWARAATGGVPTRFRSGYYLDGTPLPNSDYFSIFFVAPLGVAAMTDPSHQQWLNAIYDAVVSKRDDYYEDSVALLSLITMTGNMWSPAQEVSRPARRRSVKR